MPGLPPRLQAALQDRYVLEREIGRGGMATVYLAHDLKHDRPVALKVLRPELAATLGLERFLLEIRVTARLQHPHILPLLDSGMIETAPGASPFYAMPYVEGESLRSRLRHERQLSLDEALRLAGDVASALAYAHGQGVVHRDVKPENILLSNGQAVVADFGIARAVSLAGGDRLTSTGLALGTPHYMSPEQTAGEPGVDARADVYALGCVLYEMLAGEPPFTGPTAQAVAARSLIEPAPPVRRSRPNVSEEVEAVIARALAKVPADRFADATAFGEALARAAVAPTSQAAVTIPAPARRSARSRWWSAALATAAVLTAAAVLLARGHRPVPATIAPASSIAVLPFTPSGPDTALSRLGRDLAFTLSAELDGLGGLHVVDPHTVLAHAGPAEAGAGHDGSAAARTLGAGSLVHGSLVRVGGDVRLDLALVGADSAAALLARATVTAPPDSVAMLTDSAARALLVQIWSHGSPPTPSLDGALRTRSVQALRAFLQGEGEITHGDWGAATVSYERAIAADPAFWLAYARDLYSLHWDLVEPPDSLVAVLERHRLDLPERERLSTEAILLEERDSIGEMIARARSASERYPDSWFGWLILGDELLHDGPLLGNARTDARSAFERAVTLNPNLIPAWEHMMLVALADGDTAAAGRALDALARLRAGPTLTANGYGTQLLQFRFLDAIQRGDSTLIRALIDSVAHDPAPSAVPDGSFFDPYRYGAFAEQIEVSRTALAAAGPPDRQRVQRLLLALSWGGRGAWDSALVNLDRVSAGGADSVAALRTYGLAVAGVWLDALEPRDAIARRPAAADAARAGRTGLGELAWLDGVLAAAQRDRRGLAAARAALGRSGDPGSAALDRSLGAFDASLRGAGAEAGRTMAALEWEAAALADPDFVSHPFVLPLDRLAAARWLAAAGDAEEALRLLRWADGVFYLHPSTIYGLMFAGLADFERGRIEKGLGHDDLAAGYYRRFLQRYDRPVPRHAALVQEARARASQRPALESP